jgi:hypothetical protein
MMEKFLSSIGQVICQVEIQNRQAVSNNLTVLILRKKFPQESYLGLESLILLKPVRE